MAASDQRPLTFCILASGPSMCQDDADLIWDWKNGDDRQVIAINTTFRLAPWSDHVYACDDRWWKEYHDEVRSSCLGRLWTYYKHTADGFDIEHADIPKAKTGGNSGVQAARLAITELGAERMILVGYDMKGGHWHGNHPQGFPNPTPDNFRNWIGHLGNLRKEFPSVVFLNATRDTAIPDQVIPRVGLEQALALA